MRATVNLLPGGRHRVLEGHPWVYRSEIGAIDGSYSQGDIVEVRDSRGKFICVGYLNPASVITVRALTWEDRDIDAQFFRDAVMRAVQYRQTLFSVSGPFGKEGGGYRLVHSEGDFLPGLIVDCFAGYVSFQTLTYGIDRWKETLIDAIRQVVEPLGIYERNDAPVRKVEGLGLRSAFCGETFDPLVEMDEGDARIIVDIQKGQKTGYFLDQTDNRLALGRVARGRRVLDAFSYSGGFGIAALRGGAESVQFMDLSQGALDLARLSVERNGFSGLASYTAANVFDALREFDKSGVKFGAVALDPPAFARSRKSVPTALAGYKEINLRAMKIVAPGGFLCTSSCSHHVSPTEFDSMLEDAALDAKVRLRLVERRTQRRDHPVLVGVPETEYLKFRMFQVT